MMHFCTNFPAHKCQSAGVAAVSEARDSRDFPVKSDV